MDSPNNNFSEPCIRSTSVWNFKETSNIEYIFQSDEKLLDKNLSIKFVNSVLWDFFPHTSDHSIRKVWWGVSLCNVFQVYYSWVSNHIIKFFTYKKISRWNIMVTRLVKVSSKLNFSVINLIHFIPFQILQLCDFLKLVPWIPKI